MAKHSASTGGVSRRFFLLAGLSLPVLPHLAHAAPLLTFDTMYQSNSVLGLKFSAQTQSMRGLSIKMRGYMAPPLKPESQFFVLTQQPVAICPFCSSDAEWPIDIVVVYLKNTLSPTNFTEKIEVEGRLELGTSIDPQTGFVSQVRLVDAVVRKT